MQPPSQQVVEVLRQHTMLHGKIYVYSRNGNRDFKYSKGWRFQDVRAPDTLHEPRTGIVPQLEWQNKVATVYNARRTGKLFLPLPGPYQLSEGEVPRGGAEPQVTSITGTTLDAQTVNELFAPVSKQINQVRGRRALQAVH